MKRFPDIRVARTVENTLHLVALGSATIAAAAVALVDPTSPIAAVGVFALIAFHLAVGWRTYRAG